MERKIKRKCPKCGGEARIVKQNGHLTTYYCECKECGLRAIDCWSIKLAVHCWENDHESYFFYKKD